MVTTYCPVIRKDQFESFRRVMGNHLPNTYNEWLYLHTKYVANAEGRLETIVEIEIDPNEFARFAAAHGGETTLHALENCAVEKAIREGK